MSENPTKDQIPDGAVSTQSAATITATDSADPDAPQRARLLAQVQQLNLQLEQRNRQLTALYEIGQTLAATLDIREIYRGMFREIAQKMLGASHLLIALFDAETETLSCSFAISDNEELDPTQFPPLRLGVGPASDTIRTHQPRIVD